MMRESGAAASGGRGARVDLSRRHEPRAPDASFRVTLGPQPIDTATSLQPFVDFGLALEAFDVAKLAVGTVSLDLPLALGDALVFEFDSGLAHAAVMPAFGWRGQRGAARRDQADAQQEPI
jgi:hypothetical protein